MERGNRLGNVDARHRGKRGKDIMNGEGGEI
jgi:hypothetical protein